MTNVLIHNIKLNVKLGDKYGEEIPPDIRFLLYYHGYAMKPIKEHTTRGHSNQSLWSELDLLISEDKHINKSKICG